MKDATSKYRTAGIFFSALALAASASLAGCTSATGSSGAPEDQSGDGSAPATGSVESGGATEDSAVSLPIDAAPGRDSAASPAVDSGAAARGKGGDAGSGADARSDGSAVEASTDATGSPDAAATSTDGGNAAYDPCPTDGSDCKILPLGDSITFGIQFPGAYRVELFQDAVTDHKKVTFLGDPTLANGPVTVAGMPFPQDNQGHSGWTINQIAGLIPSPALQPIPDIILLMIGTNDMYSTTMPVAQAPQRLGALLDQIIMAAPRSLLVVAQITPLQNTTWEAQVVIYDAALPAVVQARAATGAHIQLVDQHTGFDVPTMLSSDGIHPNETGYNHMGDVWYAAIKSVLP